MPEAGCRVDAATARRPTQRCWRTTASSTCPGCSSTRRWRRASARQIDAWAPTRPMDQLQRLERSVLRLERVNLQTLGMLKKLVNAVKKTSGEAAE